MKKDKSYYNTIVIILTIMCIFTSFIVANNFVLVGKFLACAHVIIYPISYFLFSLYNERYGETKSITLIFYVVFALLFGALLLIGTNALPIYGADNSLAFEVDFRILFGLLLAFVIGQYTNLKIYNAMCGNKSFIFLISSVVSIAIDSILFIVLSFAFTVEIDELFRLIAGEYILSILSIIFYAVGFSYLIGTLINTRDKLNKPSKAIKVKNEQ